MSTHCEQCGVLLESPLVCGACGTLHALPELGENGKPISPFAMLGLEERYVLDAKDLRKRLLRFSRHLHPDFFGTAPPALRALAERNTAELNDAHEKLVDDFARATWLVRSRGGPGEQELRDMPQAFLMEVLEWNEALEEARDAAPGAPERAALADLGVELKEQREELFERVATLLAGETSTPEQLADTRRALNAVRYVDRTLAEMERLRLEQASTRSN